ncbi:putative PHD transcription factor [Aspergillus glaucus CBS 516.65]|uniref:PHD-type domain-containing protein n=1 Tax=Aspergillus glaucus CBS 516.65 TaxID=1160497 RepID=A0A1L9VNI4_ASPGL|nr:hypothetical protein ASPGLDRAFT_123700 [Aspergillus glaucus CBS 516.65]OJJ85485.1 hypothetical protein ASPGLDRAFT_123700 [Aspergillus glaucus CBS 516.65]
MVADSNPYETHATRIPKDDPYISRSPQYGRYAPRDDDFKPRYDRWYLSEPEVNSYWEKVVRNTCVQENSLNDPRTQDAFASGSVVIRVDEEGVDDSSAERYSYVNANEISSARKAEDALKEIGIAVPVIYFCGVVDGKNVTVESRVPGVSLEVAWRYLAREQIDKLKQQCRRIIQRLAAVDSASDGPSYVCSGLNSHLPPDVSEQEKKILFKEKAEQDTLYLTHNDLVRSNIIVKDDQVVGVLGWRQCGLFGLDRAARVHKVFRVPEISYLSGDGDDADGAMAWADLYDGVSETSVKSEATAPQDATEPQVKTEPDAMNLEKLPASEDADAKPALGQLDGADLPNEHPTPKKIANLKHGLTSRASSSERSSPANSTKGAATGRKSTGGGKKGTAKKSTAKKRKVNDQDTESVDSRRSNTPSSTRASKTPAVKKQGSASAAGSPAPVPVPQRKPKKSKKAAKNGDGDDDDDDDGVFCICRRGDNHTWMIGCDGECDDWFHGKCVNIDRRDADLIDKYICPNCHEKGKGRTSWKPMCRLPECRKPARVNQKGPSKYCSDDHGREFMRLKTQHFLGPGAGIANGDQDPKARDDIGSRGGVLTASELKAAITDASSAIEFRRLGERIVTPPPEEEDDKKNLETQDQPKKEKKLGLDVDAKGLTYTPDEAAKLEKLRKRRDEILHRQELLTSRDTFINLVRQRSKTIVERLKQTDPKGGWKDICGYDSRVAWADEEFDEWRQTPVGEKAMKDGTLDPPTDADGDTAMDEGNNKEGSDNEDDNGIEALARGVCTKKRCERHKQWVKVHQEDILFEQNTAQEDIRKCEDEAQIVVERAVLRMWAEIENAHVGGA